MIDVNKTITIGVATVTIRDALIALQPTFDSMQNEWTGYSIDTYIKFLVGTRTSQYINPIDDAVISVG